MEAHGFYEAGPSRKKSLEWDLNDWRWDGNLFLATPLDCNVVPSECRNNYLSSESEETGFGMVGKGKEVPEKRRRIVVVEDEQHCDSEAGLLALNLRGNAYPVVEAGPANWDWRNDNTRSNLQGASLCRLPCCQVEGCEADLSQSKDYHRRHKVCEMHSKASSAVVKNVVQRFCQQCSRFHLLQEFDEGKRSCRRRLAGHNRRRRKTLPNGTTNVDPLIDGQATSCILISLLRILTNLNADSSDQSKDQNLLSHLLRSLATLAGSFDAKFCSEQQALHDSQKLGTSAGTSSPNGLISDGVPAQASTGELPSTPEVTCPTSFRDPSLRPVNHSVCVAATTADISSKKHLTETCLDITTERVRLREFDLNNAYTDTENFIENDNSPSPACLGTGSPPSCLLQDSHQSSPPQTSANSESAPARSRSSSNGDAQSRTDRIVFKLFGKEPSDMPLALRSQILAWLAHSPTEMESYIRPGCVILTIYLHLAELAWEELCSDLSSNLNRLLYNSDDNFWRTGWVYVRIQHHIAFIYNGKILLSTPRLLPSPCQFNIVSVSPVAAAISSSVSFTVKGLNLTHSTGRLLCAFEGKYLVREMTQALAERGREHEGLECLNFSCSLPNTAGRGFIEVEDDSLSSCFFPFIVAEDDVCSEIRGLEKVIDVAIFEDERQERADNPRSQALYFLNEMGWLLRRSQLRLTSKQVNSHSDLFSLAQYKWLVAFAMDQEWCAVVRSLLDLLFHETINVGVSPHELALSEGLLYRAVRKNCRSLVEFLLRYKPDSAKDSNSFIFRPDMPGPSGLTPLHVVASVSGAESVLSALTDDPGQLGLKAWRNARDTTGFTPEDYARSRGHESYLNLVNKKLDKQSDNGHVVLDMPSSPSAPSTTYNYKQADVPKYLKPAGFETEKEKKKKLKPTQQLPCSLCSQQLVRRMPVARSLLYRPAMLSMVGIAAVCVCVGLLFKGPPEVSCVLAPFSWERLSYGSS